MPPSPPKEPKVDGSMLSSLFFFFFSSTPLYFFPLPFTEGLWELALRVWIFLRILRPFSPSPFFFLFAWSVKGSKNLFPFGCGMPGGICYFFLPRVPFSFLVAFDTADFFLRSLLSAMGNIPDASFFLFFFSVYTSFLFSIRQGAKGSGFRLEGIGFVFSLFFLLFS